MPKPELKFSQIQTVVHVKMNEWMMNKWMNRKEITMVNLMCQLDWAKECPDSWEDIISGGVCEGFSRKD